MPYEVKDNTGSLWADPKVKVSQKTGNEYQSYGGSARINGVDYWINGILKQTPNGKRVYDLQFKPKEQVQPAIDVSF